MVEITPCIAGREPHRTTGGVFEWRRAAAGRLEGRCVLMELLKKHRQGNEMRMMMKVTLGPLTGLVREKCKGVGGAKGRRVRNWPTR